MWGWRKRNTDRVDCVACGTTVARSSAREYDKEGDRWERDGKEFEHVCKPCYRDLCHQPRPGLEALLVDIEREGRMSRDEFLARYDEVVVERYGSLEPK
jgi:Zn ribbon nucleic-acid-binding protein